MSYIEILVFLHLKMNNLCLKQQVTKNFQQIFRTHFVMGHKLEEN